MEFFQSGNTNEPYRAVLKYFYQSLALIILRAPSIHNSRHHLSSQLEPKIDGPNTLLTNPGF